MRKRIVAILAVCYVTTLLPILPTIRTASASAQTDKPYYIIDEEFAFVRPKDWTILAQRPSGWTVKAAGGELSSGYNTWFKVADHSNQLPVEMCKWFREETDGFYTLEYRFNFSKMMEDTAWRVRNDEKSAVSLIIKNGNLCLETGSEVKDLGVAGPIKEIGVRADFNLETKKVSVYVNGILKAENVDFKENVDSIDNFQVITGVAATGEMFLTPIKLYKNFVVNEKLISTAEGDFPMDWELDKSGGTAVVSKINSTTPPDFFSLKLSDTSNTSAVSMQKIINDQTGPLSYEFKMMAVTKANGISSGIYSGDAKVFEISTKDGGFVYTDENAAVVTIPGYSDYLANLWYSFRITLDTDTKKADLWVNGRKAAVGIDLPQATGAINKLTFSTGIEQQNVLWIDDITLVANPPLPADYVPLPKNNAAEDDKLIGMQNCSLWREGHHLGWDYISGWPERTPVLGFYDEGDTEVADWQTKFLVENGIDFQLTSWFRPNNGVDTPIKDPYTATYALHQGYFYSEYSDMLKYSIYWENGGPPSRANGSEDFRKNFVPFWIEYYFKDPRYLKIDNKPVISILTYSGLTRDFGSPEGIKAEMDYLKAECVKAGFDGAIILSIHSGGTRDDQELKKASGIDALYAYGWDFSGKSIEYQMNTLTNQQNVGIMDIVPNLSTGNDYTAWGHSLFQGGYATPEEFQKLAQWAKDEYMPKDKGLGNKLLLLGIWNEYGEGSYLAPTGLAGFGYLDAIRNAFLPGKTADNIVPSQASLERMSRLYSEPGRYIAPIADTRPKPSNTVQQGWYFDTAGDFEGWDVTRHAEGLKVDNGMISGTATDTDPGIISPDDLAINIDNTPHIRLTHNNSISGVRGEIYFITESDQKWDEAKCVRYLTEQEVDGKSITTIFMGDNKNWRGTLKRIRFDPFDRSPGESFAYDSIELLGEGGDSKIKVSIDGNEQTYDQPPMMINNRTMVPLRGIFQSLGVNIDWDGRTNTVTAYKKSSNTVVEITIGAKTAYINKKPIDLDQPAEVVNGRTLVPVRFVSESLGAEVEWAEDENMVKIDTTKVAAAIEPKGPNLTPKGNMETRTIDFGNWGAKLSLNTKEFYEGKQSLQVVETEPYGCVKIDIDLKEGQEYYYSAWAKLDPSSTKGLVLRVMANYSINGEYKSQSVLTSAPLSSEKWTQVSGTYVIPEGSPISETYVSILVDRPPGKETFYLDDVKVIKVDAE